MRSTNLGKRKEVTDTGNPEDLTPTVTATLTLPRNEDAPPSPARKRKKEEPDTPEVPIKKEAFLNHPDTEEESLPTMLNIKQEPGLWRYVPVGCTTFIVIIMIIIIGIVVIQWRS